MNRASHPTSRVRITRANKLARALWGVVWLLLYRPSPVPLHAWRRALLRIFGAKIGAGATPYPSARIWAPWNLEMGERSCLASQVDCYCVAKITLGRFVTVSQYSYLCSGGHDYRSPDLPMPLTAAAISIEDNAWVAAAVFLGPGVCIGSGAVVGARSTVVSDVEPWTVVAGSPPRRISTRAKFTRDN